MTAACVTGAHARAWPLPLPLPPIPPHPQYLVYSLRENWFTEAPRWTILMPSARTMRTNALGVAALLAAPLAYQLLELCALTWAGLVVGGAAA